MRSQKVYCGACDRNVRVLITNPPTVTEGQAPLHDSEVVCLEIGEHCTGGLCPLGASAPDDMVRRLMHSGIPLEGLRTVTALCPECEFVSEMALQAGGHATCLLCGSTVSWKIEVA